MDGSALKMCVRRLARTFGTRNWDTIRCSPLPGTDTLRCKDLTVKEGNGAGSQCFHFPQISESGQQKQAPRRGSWLVKSDRLRKGHPPRPTPWKDMARAPSPQKGREATVLWHPGQRTRQVIFLSCQTLPPCESPLHADVCSDRTLDV